MEKERGKGSIVSRLIEGSEVRLPGWVIHCFDALTFMCLVVAAAHVLCVCVPVACQFLLSLAAFLLYVCVCVSLSLNGHVTLNSRILKLQRAKPTAKL